MLIMNFLEKFFFVLKAASDGWSVRYHGGNKFQFTGKMHFPHVDSFIARYRHPVLAMI